jgi:hypothetical protein
MSSHLDLTDETLVVRRHHFRRTRGRARSQRHELFQHHKGGTEDRLPNRIRDNFITSASCHGRKRLRIDTCTGHARSCVVVNMDLLRFACTIFCSKYDLLLGTALGAKDIRSLLMRRTPVGAYAVIWFGGMFGPLSIGYNGSFGSTASYILASAVLSEMYRNCVSSPNRYIQHSEVLLLFQWIWSFGVL